MADDVHGTPDDLRADLGRLLLHVRGGAGAGDRRAQREGCEHTGRE
jgi:hypothetical protein